MLRLTCLVFIFAALAAADVQTGVVRSGGQPIPGATVTADCGADKITTVTDGDGRFEMGGLPSTPCRFSVAMFGFEPTPVEAKASSTPISFDLKLQARATLPVEPTPVAAPKAPETVATATTPATCRACNSGGSCCGGKAGRTAVHSFSCRGAKRPARRRTRAGQRRTRPRRSERSGRRGPDRLPESQPAGQRT